MNVIGGVSVETRSKLLSNQNLRKLQIALSPFAFPLRMALSAAKGLGVNSAKIGARVGGVREKAPSRWNLPLH
jgi:hypothetical protein